MQQGAPALLPPSNLRLFAQIQSIFGSGKNSQENEKMLIMRERCHKRQKQHFSVERLTRLNFGLSLS